MVVQQAPAAHLQSLPAARSSNGRATSGARFGQRFLGVKGRSAHRLRSPSRPRKNSVELRIEPSGLAEAAEEIAGVIMQAGMKPKGF